MANSTLHRWLLVFFLLFARPALGGELHYGAAPHEAGWQVAVARHQCRMAQEIPYYGHAIFRREAGRDLEFTISVRQHAPKASQAHLQSLPPAWIHSAAPLDLGQVNSATGDVPFVLQGDQARRLLAELEKGMSPTLSYRDWGDNRDEVVVSVSAVNLRKSLPHFLTCLDGLLPFPFSDVRSSTLNFPLASASLSPANRQRLERVAQYALADDRVKGVHVTGHTDSLGFRTVNHRLSVRRAKAVRDFLVRQGVPAAKIRVEHAGEAKPRASNRTEAGRALNRRVEVTLLQ